MNKAAEITNRPCCLACGHQFGLAEVAAMTARAAGHEDLCVIDCLDCGAHNEVRAVPQGGFDAQPALQLRRLVDEPLPDSGVFRATA